MRRQFSDWESKPGASHINRPPTANSGDTINYLFPLFFHGPFGPAWHADKTWQPAMAAEDREKGYLGWKKAVERNFNWME